MSTRFFTNHGEQTLLRKFQGVFESNPDIEWFDAIVGYLRSSGYFALRPFLEKVPHIRILVGINVDAIMADYHRRGLPDEINLEHQLVIVAAELDSGTERIINYLSKEYSVPINAVFFRYFKEGKSEYLARTWLIDPAEAEAKASTSGGQKKGKEPWNGTDFYVALGENAFRNWDDCRKYGFVSGGQGRWYSKTLEQLFVGARVFVCIPNSGY